MKIFFFSDHHLSHAASAFFPSPFDEAVILTADGVGEWATTTVAVGKNETLEISKSFRTQNTFKGKIGVFEIKDNKINHQLNFYEINDGKLKEIF